MTGAPDPIGLESPACEHDVPGGNDLRDIVELDHDAGNAKIGTDQIPDPGVIENVDAGFLRRPV